MASDDKQSRTTQTWSLPLSSPLLGLPSRRPTRFRCLQFRQLCKIRSRVSPSLQTVSQLSIQVLLLYGIFGVHLDKLQRVLNSAARIVTLSKRRDHITPLLKDLHWLPVHQHINYKILLLTFKALHGLTPSYISELISVYKPKRTLRSSNELLLSVKPYFTKTYGSRSFSVAAPTLWNSLPSYLRNQS
ncbi:hypothetical protein AC249_AIPGENE22575 [Exaiptasia diaphana]|nr:hypothetical protein AC249_AIPGENE22575 [Exaiptasia diaphana]